MLTSYLRKNSVHGKRSLGRPHSSKESSPVVWKQMLHQKGPPRTSEDTVVKAQAQTSVITILRTPFLGRTWRQKCFLLFGNAFLSLTLAPMAASLLTSPTPPTHCPPLPAWCPAPNPKEILSWKEGWAKEEGTETLGPTLEDLPQLSACEQPLISSGHASTSFLPIPVLLSLPRESSSFCLLDQIRLNNVTKGLDTKEATVSKTPMRNICKPFLCRNVIIHVGYVYSTAQPQCQIFCDLKAIFVGLLWLPNCPYKIVAVGKSTWVPENLLITHLPPNQLSLLYGWLAWKIPWTEEPGRLQSLVSLRGGDNWETSFSLFTFMHWRRKWQPTPVFLLGESQGQRSLVGCRLWGRTESDTTEVT